MVATLLVHAPPPARVVERRCWGLRVFMLAGPGTGDEERGLFASLRTRLPGTELALIRPGWDSPDPVAGVSDVLVIPTRGGDAALAQQAKRAMSERSPLAERFARWLASLSLHLIETEAPLPGLSAGGLELRSPKVLDGEGLCDAVEGLVSALEGGQSVRQALRSANTLVASRGGARDALQGRWTDPDAADVALRAPFWRPLGWPAPSPEAGQLLQDAWQLARSRNSGFVGVEHVVELLPQHAPGLPKRVIDALRSGKAALRHYAELEVRPHAEPDWDGTPRLGALGQGLKEDFSLGDLARVLLSPASPLVRALVEAPRAAGEAPPALSLEVYGGPEDGRPLSPEPGDHVGRGADAAMGLYVATLRTDPRLARRHLEWLGPGRVVLDRTATVHRPAGAELLGPGICELRVGEVLALTRATRVRGVG